MNGSAYYNEHDPRKAAWLRELMRAGAIAPGDVDERSIRDVRGRDLAGYSQCHFFAGIGVWSYALRCAGWPDDRPVWTGSCPCQPFSAAGKRQAQADDRHLWPELFRLIQERQPERFLGEQVASKDGLAWLDLVLADLESADYAAGAIDLCAAGVGAPHIRQRLYWLADASGEPSERNTRGISGAQKECAGSRDTDGGHNLGHPDGCDAGGLADATIEGSLPGALGGIHRGEEGTGPRYAEPERSGSTGGLEHAAGAGRQQRGSEPGRGSAASGCSNGRMADADSRQRHGFPDGKGSVLDGKAAGREQGHREPQSSGDTGRPSPLHGFWRDADWLGCRDGKWRPVEARPQPLADGSAESLGRVRPEIIEEIEEILDAAAVETKSTRSEVLRTLRKSLEAQARHLWTPGRVPGIHEAPFLLALLREFEEQRRDFAESSALPRPEAQGAMLRVLRDQQEAAGSSHQRELEGQHPFELADLMRVLPPLLARYAQEAWGHAHETYAEIGFPIGHGSPARVGRLRGYGDAIVAPLAEEFIRAVMEMAP